MCIPTRVIFFDLGTKRFCEMAWHLSHLLLEQERPGNDLPDLLAEQLFYRDWKLVDNFAGMYGYNTTDILKEGSQVDVCKDPGDHLSRGALALTLAIEVRSCRSGDHSCALAAHCWLHSLGYIS